jgi:hypothetical protein
MPDSTGALNVVTIQTSHQIPELNFKKNIIILAANLSPLEYWVRGVLKKVTSISK